MIHLRVPMISHIPFWAIFLTKLLSFFLDLYKFIWNRGDFPSFWDVAVIVLMPKPKKDHQLTTNYHSTSLTSCICTVSSWKKGWISALSDTWRDSITCLLFSMVSGKYDLRLSLYCPWNLAFIRHLSVFFLFRKSLRHSLAPLFEFGLRGRLSIFIKEFLSRFLRIQVSGDLSGVRPLEDGVPQGSILVPHFLL